MAGKNKNNKKEKSSVKSFHDEMLLKPTEELENLDVKDDEKVTLDILEKNKRRRLEFASQEEKRGWEKAYRKRKLYMPYFLLGMAFNFLLYRLGLDLSQDILRGLLVGMGVPFLFMFLLTELHYHFFWAKRADS